VERQVLEVPDPGQKIDPQHMREPENRERLALRIGVDLLRLGRRLILEKGVDEVDGFPDSTGNES
jgi:hypothetical protein